MFADVLRPYVEKLGLIETEEMKEKRALISKDEPSFEVLRTQVASYVDAIQEAIDALEDSQRKFAILAQSLLLAILYEELDLQEFCEDALDDAYIYAGNMSSGDDIYFEVKSILGRRG